MRPILSLIGYVICKKGVINPAVFHFDEISTPLIGKNIMRKTEW